MSILKQAWYRILTAFAADEPAKGIPPVPDADVVKNDEPHGARDTIEHPDKNWKAHGGGRH